MDFGDAPDRVRGKVPGSRRVARFPSRRSSNGARHAVPDRIHLGRSVTVERDSAQVDRDRGDDGFAPLLRSCRVSEFRFTVDASGLSARQLRRGTAYLNAWFDWRRDGDWQDRTRCPLPRAARRGARRTAVVGEWAIRNRKLDLSRFVGDPVQTIVLRAPAGPARGPLWHRASVTLKPFQGRIRVPATRRAARRSAAAPSARRGRSRLILNDGRGAFRFGESEDGMALPRNPRSSGSCRIASIQGPGSKASVFGIPIAQLEHGSSVVFRLTVNGKPPKSSRLVPALSTIPNPKSYGIEQHKPNPLLPPRAGFWLLTTTEDPPEGTDLLDLAFRVTAPAGPSALALCLADVAHTEEGEPPPEEEEKEKIITKPPEEEQVITEPPEEETKPACSDGADNDGDGKVDDGDPGCLSKPGAEYDPLDESEQEVTTTVSCEEAGATQHELKEPIGTELVGLSIYGNPGEPLAEAGKGDPDFEEGQETEIPCGDSFFDVFWEFVPPAEEGDGPQVLWTVESQGGGEGSREVTMNANSRPRPDPVCSDGGDNDGDGKVDDEDPGCLSKPGAEYDPLDESEEDVTTAVACGQEDFPLMELKEPAGVEIKSLSLIGGPGEEIVHVDHEDADFENGHRMDVPCVDSFFDVFWDIQAAADPSEGTTAHWQFESRAEGGTGSREVTANANTRCITDTGAFDTCP